MPHRGDQRVLERVGRFFGVRHRAQRHGPQVISVPPEDLGERVGIARAVAAQQLRVVGLVVP